MAILIFCMVSAVIARFINKRSSLLCVIHAIFFMSVLPFYFFASNTPLIADMMQRLYGEETYLIIKAAVMLPCVGLYSANVVLCLVEIVMLAVVLIGFAVHLTRKFIKGAGEPFERKVNEYNDAPFSLRVSFIELFNRIFLKFGKLLN